MTTQNCTSQIHIIIYYLEVIKARWSGTCLQSRYSSDRGRRIAQPQELDTNVGSTGISQLKEKVKLDYDSIVCCLTEPSLK